MHRQRPQQSNHSQQSDKQWCTSISVAPYSRPVPYSRHPPYSRHFFNDTHENDPVWALFPIAVSDDHFSTQVCKEILSILSFLEKLLSSIMPNRLRLTFRSSTEHYSFWNPALILVCFAQVFPCLFGLKLTYIEHFLYFYHHCCSS